ncbi:MAG TPA: YifB family Mg chelatase-like AAA ATPase [Candidatus Pacearchaeota archaeon]|nr:YifB family Mg chelatase-like AAA ATPase [Candidatus Pacearchaeota archaeon]
MPAKVYSVAIVDFDAQIIEVELEISYGLRCFDIIGLPDKAVQESKDRVSIAIKNCGFKAPLSSPHKVLVSLAPADLKKEGSFYDLPIALGYLLRSGQINFNPDKKIFIGELSLNGEIKPAKGILASTLAMKNKDIKEIILPEQNKKEAALAFIDLKDKPKIIGVKSLKQAINYLNGKEDIKDFSIKKENLFEKNEFLVDIGWIKGQEFAKRALEISAAGGHNFLMVGPPGGGKSLLAKSMPSIMPPLTIEEMIEVTKIYSLSGILKQENPLITTRPFRSPHHSASTSAIIGGGNPVRPGEITLAHRGVLFLDEFPEFHRDVLEALRQPIEDGTITLSRAKQRITVPCRFTLVAAANPTPGGFFENQRNQFYSHQQVSKYKRKMSGPILDRMDLYVELPNVSYEKLIEQSDVNESQKIREKVIKTRIIQKNRLAGEGIMLNSEMTPPLIKKYCQIDEISQRIIKKLVDSGSLSARGYHRLLKVSRTIADLDFSKDILQKHVSEALIYRPREEI